jgi:RHS repeat-associated protein
VLDSLGVTVSYRSFGYDQAGELTLNINGGSLTTVNSYDGGNLTLSLLKDPFTQTISWQSFSYDTANELTTINVGGLISTVNAYDGGYLTLAQVLDSTGTTIRYQSFGYDAAGETTLSNDGGLVTTSSGYDAGLMTLNVVKDSLAHTLSWQSFTFDTAGEMTTQNDGGSVTTANSFDGGNLTLQAIENVSGQTVSWQSFGYDLAGETTLTNNGGLITVSDAFDGGNLTLAVVKDTLGATVGWRSYSYDTANELTTINAGGLISTVNAYDGGNLTLQNVLDSLGHTMTYRSFAYDSAGELTSENDGGKVTTSNHYDGGNLTLQAVLDSSGATMSFLTWTYDLAMEPAEEKGGLITTANSYDGGNLTLSIIKGSGGATVGYTSYSWNQAGQIIDVYGGNGQTTATSFDGVYATLSVVQSATATVSWESFAFNAAGEQTLTVDGDHNSTSLGYNANLVTLQQVFNSLGTQVYSQSYGYDSAAEMVSGIDGDNHTRSYDYDGGNLVSESWYNTNGTFQQALNFSYDVAGELLTAGNSAGSYTFGYQGGLLTQQIDPNGLTINMAYDQAGSVTLTSDSQGGTIGQSFDGGNLAAENYQNGSTVALMSLSYDLANELTAVTRYSDLLGSTVVGTESRGYSGGLITSILDKNGSGTTLASFGYSYNTSGELTQEVNNGTTTACGYDAGGQLTVAGSQSQSYDTNGNRSASSITIGSDNRLLGDGTWNYTWSTGGNLITRSQVSGSLSWSYDYNAANEMTLAVETSGTTTLVNASYSYDAFGARIGETVTQSGTTTTTHQSYLAVKPPMVGADATNFRLYADLSSSNTVQTRYLGGRRPDKWFARVDTSGVEWLLTDKRGSVRNVLNTAGSVIDTIAYDAFGNISSESIASNGGRLKYAGYQVDAWAGMDLSGARYYLPSAQIWVSPDPSGLSAGSNLYVYAGNDPLNATDPSGLFTVQEAQDFMLAHGPDSMRQALAAGGPLAATIQQGMYSALVQMYAIAYHADLAATTLDINWFEPKNLTAKPSWFSQTWVGNFLTGVGDRFVDIGQTFRDGWNLQMNIATRLLSAPARWAGYNTDAFIVDTTTHSSMGKAFAKANQQGAAGYLNLALTMSTQYMKDAAAPALALPMAVENTAAFYQAMNGTDAQQAAYFQQQGAKAADVAIAVAGIKMPGFLSSLKGRFFGRSAAAADAAAADSAATPRLRSCFPGGTPVHTPSGMKAIEQITAGELVWAFDHKQLRWVAREVTEVYQLLHQGRMATIQVQGETIRATGGHPFWVVRGENLKDRPLPVRILAYEQGSLLEGRWVLACDLRSGDEVLLLSEKIVKLDSVRLDKVEETVYNFTVEELENYAVGECGVLVHNTNDPGPKYPSFEEGAGVGPGGVDALEHIGPTQQSSWSNAGFTEAWTGYLTEFGEWWTAFKNPKTGEWGGFHISSRNNW